MPRGVGITTRGFSKTPPELTLTIFFTMMAYIFLVIIIYVLLSYVCFCVI